MNLIRRVPVLCIAILLAACSPINTRIAPPQDSKSNDGLAYYMPYQGIQVTLTVADSVRTITVAPTSKVFPDTDFRFIAQFRRSQINTKDLTVAVDTNGLLDQESKSELTPQINQIFAGVGGSSATSSLQMRNTVASGIPAETNECQAKGTYSWVIFPAPTGSPEETTTDSTLADMKLCQMTVSIHRLFNPDAEQVTDRIKNAGSEPNVSGFFYRQSRPYLLTITDTWTACSEECRKDQGPKACIACRQANEPGPQTSIVAIPTKESPIEFLPISKSLFAHNKASVTFSHGIPKVYGQDVDSEWLGVVTLPAAIVKAYFGAVGAVLDAKTAANAKEAGYLNGLNTLAAQQLKTDRCIAALKSKNNDSISANCP